MDYEVLQSRDVVSEWRVEAIDYDDEGQVYVTVFCGARARERAEAYAFAMNGGWTPASAAEEGEG